MKSNSKTDLNLHSAPESAFESTCDFKFRPQPAFKSILVWVGLIPGLVLGLSAVACGSSKGRSQKKPSQDTVQKESGDQKKDHGDPGDQAGQGDSSGKLGTPADVQLGGDGLWGSDVSDERVKPCPMEKIFANGGCYDEVQISESRISLNRGGESLTLFEAGKTLLPFILEHYRYSSLASDGSMILINERLARLDPWISFGNRYWFLPDRIRVSPTENLKDLSDAVFLGATFPLAFHYGTTALDPLGYPLFWFVKGTASLCGKVFSLPVTQGAYESRCRTVIGSADPIQETQEWGEVTFKLEALQTTVAARRVYQLELGTPP
jgi:hypothetical protein